MTGGDRSTDRERRFLETAARRGLRPPGDRPVEKTLREFSSFFARALFREETARRPGLFQRIDPRARLLAVLVFLVSVSLARSIGSLAAHALLPAAALLLARIRPKEFLAAGFLVALLFSSALAAPATLNLFRDGTVLYPLLRVPPPPSLGPVRLPEVIGVTREGLLTAATFLLRVLSSTAAVLCLTLSTRWVDLLRALRFLRLPPLFLQVVGMTVRYTHALFRSSEEAHLGRISRTVDRSSLASRQAWVASRLAHTWERSLFLMEEVGAAMAARGFRGEARFPRGAWFGAAEWTLFLVVVLSCAGAHLA